MAAGTLSLANRFSITRTVGRFADMTRRRAVALLLVAAVQWGAETAIGLPGGPLAFAASWLGPWREAANDLLFFVGYAFTGGMVVRLALTLPMPFRPALLDAARTALTAFPTVLAVVMAINLPGAALRWSLALSASTEIPATTLVALYAVAGIVLLVLTLALNGYLAVVAPVALAERPGFAGAFRRGVGLARPRLWTMIGLAVVTGLIISAGTWGVQMATGMAGLAPRFSYLPGAMAISLGLLQMVFFAAVYRELTEVGGAAASPSDTAEVFA